MSLSFYKVCNNDYYLLK